MPKVAIRPLAESFRASVLKMLKDEGRLDDTLIKKILTWRHDSGFSLHNEVRLEAGDAKGIENVAQHIIRNTFSLSKLSDIEKMGTVIYRSKMSHGGNKRNFRTYSPLEFIAADELFSSENLVYSTSPSPHPTPAVRRSAVYRRWR